MMGAHGSTGNKPHTITPFLLFLFFATLPLLMELNLVKSLIFINEDEGIEGKIEVGFCVIWTEQM